MPPRSLAARHARNPTRVADSVAIQIGHEIVGIVASLGPQAAAAEDRPWLEAAAAAAAVSSLIRETKDSDLDAARRALLQTLELAPPQDARAMVGEALRLGCDLAAGAAADLRPVDGGEARRAAQ